MKIDRARLNTILRSGLNSEIKTRKQLAACLGLDPTSLTRWFASRDRLGNPRYPVVPDRHVAKILQIFRLDPQSLSLSEEEFRQHCFETSLQRLEEEKSAEQLSQSRNKKAAIRKLSIPQPTAFRYKYLFTLLCLLTLLSIVEIFQNDVSKTAISSWNDSNELKETCWRGYSSSLGSFESEDPVDPCHYEKLLQNALLQLKMSNKNKQVSKPGTTDGYILFLSNKLAQRRLNNEIKVNAELGKSELNHLNYSAAQKHFQLAEKLVAQLPDYSTELTQELATYNSIAIYSDKSWYDARHEYESYLAGNISLDMQIKGDSKSLKQGKYWRDKAIEALNHGELITAKELINKALQLDLDNLGNNHFYIANNWLILSCILSLQADLSQALLLIESAISLDISLFGEYHPRVTQDKMVQMLLFLQSNDIAGAQQSYQYVTRFFQRFMGATHPAMKMDSDLRAQLNQLKAISLLPEGEMQKYQQQNWHNLSQIFANNTPYTPRNFAALLFQLPLP